MASKYFTYTPTLSKEHEQMIEKLYYDDNFKFGWQKLYNRLKKLHPNDHPSQRQVWRWLTQNEGHMIHVRPRKKTTIKPILVKKDGYWQGDLIDMSSRPDRTFKWILNVINVLTKKMYARPMVVKSNAVVTRVMNDIMEQIRRDGGRMTVLQSDRGSEFLATQFKKLMKDNNVKQLFSQSYSPQAQGIVERSNGTLKRLIAKYVYDNKNARWASALPQLVQQYNDSFHKSIKMTPNEASGLENKNQVYDNLRSRARKQKELPENYKVGDRVRVALKRTSALHKSSGINWTKDIYTITKVVRPGNEFSQTSYELKDDDGDRIKGRFTSAQLQAVPEGQRTRQTDNTQQTESISDQQASPRRSTRLAERSNS